MTAPFDGSEITPDLPELLQVDTPEMQPVPVFLTEAATTHVLPNRRVRIDSQVVDENNWVQIIDGSKKRSSAVIISATQPIRIRVSTSGVGQWWPAGVPYPITHTQAVFVLCATTGQTTEVGVTEEFWAD